LPTVPDELFQFLTFIPASGKHSLSNLERRQHFCRGNEAPGDGNLLLMDLFIRLLRAEGLGHVLNNSERARVVGHSGFFHQVLSQLLIDNWINLYFRKRVTEAFIRQVPGLRFKRCYCHGKRFPNPGEMRLDIEGFQSRAGICVIQHSFC